MTSCARRLRPRGCSDEPKAVSLQDMLFTPIARLRETAGHPTRMPTALAEGCRMSDGVRDAAAADRLLFHL